ncbi:MAG TPA: galactokinase family protein [Planctomycetota bacterium]|nr:galactokinase family protein [Planctomycetota bacterium]
MKPLEAFAPGRLCLFGEHQDYLGLAVIALAIDAGIRVRLEPDGSDALSIDLPDLAGTREETRDRIALDGSSPPRHARDWLRLAFAEAAAAGVRPPGGARVTVRGDLPVNAGCASSSALTVAFLRALLAFAGPGAAALAEPRRLADLAWRAEVVRPGGPGGKMDPLTSALGGLVHLSFGPTPFVQELPARLDGFVLIEGGEPKDTTGVLAATRRDVEAAFAELHALDAGLDLAAVSFDRAWTLLQEAKALAPERAARTEELVFATLYSRDLLHAALRVLAEPELDRSRVGELLDEHHARLRDALALSTPRIEALRTAALAAGALGAKVNGSGGGGSLFAYAPGCEAAVVAAARELGARARVVTASRGASVTSA